MNGWWRREIIVAGKLPLMLCFIAFVVTFATTRLVTRLIRDQRGPFHNNVTAGGTHIHHAVPGLVLLIFGAFIAVGDSANLPERCVAGVLVGIGVSLVLDEFALILHLQDVYWTGEGQLSVEVVSLTAGCLGLVLIGFIPLGVPDIGGAELTVRISATALLVIDAVLVITCVLKGKYPTALLAIFVPPLALLGAFRLARPSSSWARRRYHGAKMARAQHRATEFDKRWDPVRTKWRRPHRRHAIPTRPPTSEDLTWLLAGQASVSATPPLPGDAGSATPSPGIRRRRTQSWGGHRCQRRACRPRTAGERPP